MKNPYEQVRLRVSGNFEGNHKFNGHFFDPQITNREELSGASDADSIAAVMDKVTLHPETLEPDADTESGTGDQQLLTLDPSSIFVPQNENRTPVKKFGDLSKKKTFGIMGFMRWKSETSILDSTKPGTFIYRLA